MTTKSLLDKIDENFDREIAVLRAKLEDKLFVLVGGKTSQGVKDYFGAEVIAKGLKFTLKQLQEIDYLTVNPYKWTTDKEKNELVFRVINNYIMKYREAEAFAKRERYNATIGDELPAGIIQLEMCIRDSRYLIHLMNSKTYVDDIDHLSNRRVRTVGEQMFTQFGIGLARMARTIRERMNVRDNEVFVPIDLINSKTLSSVINSFFGTNALSQFMDQTNPLAEMTHKRRMSALGPGGLSRERAGFEVRDVHYTHYGRLCPIETPEGPNIGLISSLCVFAKINELGFIATPYRKVVNGKVDLSDEGSIYLTAEEEEDKVIAQANAIIDSDGYFITSKVKSRHDGDYPLSDKSDVDLMDVGPNQIASVAASLIPFLEHDDANRALMGANMMRQAVPLLRPEAPIVGTGLEGRSAVDSRILIQAEGEGVVKYVDANQIIVRYDVCLLYTSRCV